VINCQRFAASGFLTAFSGASSTSGFRKNPFSLFFKHKVNHTVSNGLHECVRNLKLIEHLDIKGAIQPRLYPAPLKFETPKHYSCIAPASVWFTKQWPKNKWIELINLIPTDQTIYLTGGPGDYALCEEILKSAIHPQVINLAGSLSLLESAELMRGAKMNYVNDSAPMHLCSSVNAPVTAIFCSTVPSFGFGPLSENSRIIETNEKLPCRPCGLHGFKACPKGHFQCAESIQPENVLSN
jgi:heptosyltransferase-2